MKDLRPTLLFIFAHPDDESFSGAGTSMTCAAAGARTVLVTATRGERGKAGNPPVCAPGEIAACRERELRKAAGIIGFDALHLLGYRDRELADAPPDEMRRALVTHIRRVKPTIVLTFDPNGFNVHPDHVADPRWYRDAGAAHAVPRVLWTPPIAPWDAASCDRFDDQPGADFVIDVSAWRDRRIAALGAHRSQHLSIDRHFFSKPDLDRILATEIWRQASGPPLLDRPAADLFIDL